MYTRKNPKQEGADDKKEERFPRENGDILKVRRRDSMIITAVLFAVPLFIFFTSWIYFKTRMTIWTVVAVVGCLPACKSRSEPDHDPEMQTTG